MDLRELRIIFRRNIVFAILGFGVCLAVGLAALILPDKTYATRSVVVLKIVETPDGVPDGSVPVATFQIPSIEETVRSVEMREEVRSRVDEEYQRTDVKLQTATNDSVLRIRGVSEDPFAAQAWVNEVTRVLVDRRSFPGIELEVLDLAPLRQRPISPRRSAILPPTVVFSFIGALFGTLIADRVRRSFDAKEAIRDRLGTTVLGEIPKVRALRKSRRPIVDLLDDGSVPELLTAFQTIRTNLEIRMIESGATSIALTSHDARAGKSMVTAGLSYSLASVDREVIAIDADLRFPTLLDQLAETSGPGLGDMAIHDNARVPVQSTRQPKLGVVPPGLPAGQAADVVTTTLPRVLEELATPGRLLLIDSPPQLGAPESTVVASLAGHVILVVNADALEMAQLPTSIQRIHESGANLLGVILNRVPRRKLRKDVYRPVRTSRPYFNRESAWSRARTAEQERLNSVNEKTSLGETESVGASSPGGDGDTSLSDRQN